MHTPDTITPKSRGLLVLLFFLSGCSGLIYQVVWVRWLTIYVGGSAFAVSTILTVFMGGLALGSLMASRLVDRVRDAGGLIRAYGLLELGIGLYALVFPLLCLAVKPLYASLYQRYFECPITYNLLSSLISIGLLIVPTALMGATLPFLCRYSVSSAAQMGTRVGWLYGVNTLGAALGALVCGFWMIRWLGVGATVFCAAALNLLIGAVCLAWSWFRREAGSSPPVTRAAPEDPLTTPVAGWFGIAALLAAAGFCAMGYEVIWTKLISLLVGPTTYSFTVVLFSFITGLALGSLLFGWVCDRVKSPFLLMGLTQMGAVVCALLASQLLGNSQFFFAKLLYGFRDNFALGELAKAGTLFAILLPATLLQGAVFPIAVKICTGRIEATGSSVGKLYGMNTVGALLGAFVAGFLLVPHLGQAKGLALLASLQALACTVVAIHRSPRRAVNLALPVLGCAGVLLLCLRMPRWDAALLVTAQYHRFENSAETLRSISYKDALLHGPAMLRQIQTLDRVLSIEDGIGGFVGVRESVNALGQTNRVLSVSGKADASSMGDMSTEALLGHIPMLVHPQPRQALVIGLASGITAGEMLHYPLTRLDALEISPEVVRACRAFTPWNNGVLSDPRTRVIVQDARTHLTLSEQRYDVIVSEPSNPWMAGVANLFTREFFLKVREHLNTDGVFVQWLHTYQSDWETFAIIGRTLQSVFPNTILMRTTGGYGDCLFLCFESRDGFFDLDVIGQNLQYTAQSPNLHLPAPDILTNLILDEYPGTLFGVGTLHTDGHPVLEYLTPLRLNSSRPDELRQNLMARATVGPRTTQARLALIAVDRQMDYAEFLASMFQPPFGLVNLKMATPAQRERHAKCLAGFARRNELGIPAMHGIADRWEKNVFLDAQEAAITERLPGVCGASKPRDLALAYFALGNIHAVRNEHDQAADCYAKVARNLPEFRPALQNLQVIYERTGRYKKAAEIITRLLDLGPVTPRLLTELAADTVKLGDEPKALDLLDRALAMNSKYAPALIVASTIYGNRNDLVRALDYSRRALEADSKDARGYANLAVALSKSGKQQEAREVVRRGLIAVPNDPHLLQVQRQLR